MATTFTQQQKVWIRHYLGYSRLRSQLSPALENALIAAQELAISEDGGALVDWVIAQLTSLQALDARLQIEWPIHKVNGADDATSLDAVRAMMGLRSEGRRLVTALAVALDTRPQVDVYSSTSPSPGNPGSSLMVPGW